MRRQTVNTQRSLVMHESYGKFDSLKVINQSEKSQIDLNEIAIQATLKVLTTREKLSNDQR